MKIVTLLKLTLISLAVIFICNRFHFQDRIHRNSSQLGVHHVDMVAPVMALGPKKDWIYRQWSLDIPKAYVGNWSGRGGGGKRYAEEDFWMSLYGVLDPDTMHIRSYPSRQAWIEGSNNKVRIKIKKGGGRRHFPPGELCMTREDYLEIAGPGGGFGECRPQNKLCNVVMQKDRWSTDFAIDRKYFDDLETACEAVSAFLDEMTIVREKLDNSTGGE